MNQQNSTAQELVIRPRFQELLDGIENPTVPDWIKEISEESDSH